MSNALARLQPLLRHWKGILAGKDPNSVENQMLTLAWDDAVYRCFNEALHLANKHAPPLPSPGTLAELVHSAFVARQALTIRRLLDPKAKTPGWDVFSLPTVLDKVCQKWGDVTRQNYVCYDGTPYEPPQDSSRWRQAAASSLRHRVFDTLSGRRADQRTRHDTIDRTLLDAVGTHLRSDRLLREYVNKYLAHGADPANRQRIDPELHRVTLLYIQRLYRLLIWACKLLGKIADQLVLTEVSAAPFDQFENWDAPMVTKKGKSRLYRYWNQRVAFFAKWSQVYWDSGTIYRSPNRR